MNYSKICVCGDKQIEITENTKVEIREARKEDIELFKNSHWIHSEEYPLNRNFWEKLITFFNDTKDSDAINRLLIKLSYNHYYWFISHDIPVDIVIDIAPNQSDVIIWAICDKWSYSGERIGEFKLQIGEQGDKFVNDHEGKPFHYPMGFYKLLTLLEKYLDEEMNRKTSFRKKTIPLTEGSKKLVSFLSENHNTVYNFKKFAESVEKRLENDESYQRFCKDKRVLERIRYNILDVDGKIFVDNYCGFDINAKEKEILKIIEELKAERMEEEKRIQNSNDPGEKEVEYAIKWFLANTKFNVVSIRKICESKYRYGCIMLKKADFIDEPQEYDHILVCNAGVILIETKHWKGRVEIRPDGKWVRDKNNDGHIVGEKSPVTQMKRHETLIQKILPNVPIYSLLCFSNADLIIDGAENCRDFQAIYVDQLNDVLSNILSKAEPHEGAIDYIVSEIEKHMVNLM